MCDGELTKGTRPAGGGPGADQFAPVRVPTIDGSSHIQTTSGLYVTGVGDGTRTHDLLLGKETFYR